jgi:hypothetical protein
MALAIKWDNNPGPVSGSTSFGYYDTDAVFQAEAPKMAKFIAGKLGYPVVDVEIDRYRMYDAIEEAVTEYSSQVHQFTIRENMMNLQGAPLTGSSYANYTNRNVPTALGRVIQIADDYGANSAFGVGGNVSWKKISIPISSSIQDYDLNALIAAVSESGNRIKIRRVFHHEPVAFGFGMSNNLNYPGTIGPGGASSAGFLSEFGWQGLVPGLATGLSYTVMPVYEDLLRMQAIEFNNQIRRSGFGFELRNNQLRLFPIPLYDDVLWLEYTVDNDTRLGTDAYVSGSVQNPSMPPVVTNVANAPYNNMTYASINDPGKRWILKYAVACAKDRVAEARSKYSVIPIPNGEVTLNGEALKQEAQQEKEALIQQLLDMLEKSGPRAQMESQREQAENLNTTLKYVPVGIVIG